MTHSTNSESISDAIGKHLQRIQRERNNGRALAHHQVLPPPPPAALELLQRSRMATDFARTLPPIDFAAFYSEALTSSPPGPGTGRALAPFIAPITATDTTSAPPRRKNTRNSLPKPSRPASKAHRVPSSDLDEEGSSSAVDEDENNAPAAPIPAPALTPTPAWAQTPDPAPLTGPFFRRRRPFLRRPLPPPAIPKAAALSVWSFTGDGAAAGRSPTPPPPPSSPPPDSLPPPRKRSRTDGNLNGIAPAPTAAAAVVVVPLVAHHRPSAIAVVASSSSPGAAHMMDQDPAAIPSPVSLFSVGRASPHGDDQIVARLPLLVPPRATAETPPPSEDLVDLLQRLQSPEAPLSPSPPFLSMALSSARDEQQQWPLVVLQSSPDPPPPDFFAPSPPPFSHQQQRQQQQSSPPPAPAFSSRPVRQAKLQARKETNRQHIVYGDFVKLRPWERGVPAPRDEDVRAPTQTQQSTATGQESQSSPTSSPRSPLGPCEWLGRVSEMVTPRRAAPRPSFDSVRRQLPPPPPRLPPVAAAAPRVMLEFGNRQRLQSARRQAASQAPRERASDLFDRMVISSSTLRHRASPQTTRRARDATSNDDALLPASVATLMRRSPTQPAFVRVAARTLRKSLSTTVANSAAPVSPRTAKSKIYGEMARKVTDIDADATQALFQARLEHATLSPSRASRDAMVQVAARSLARPRSPPRIPRAPNHRGGSGGRGSVDRGLAFVAAIAQKQKPSPAPSRPRRSVAHSALATHPHRHKRKSKNHIPRRRPERIFDSQTLEHPSLDSEAVVARLPPSQHFTARELIREPELDAFTLPTMTRRPRTSTCPHSADAGAFSAPTVRLCDVQVRAMLPPTSCSFCLVAHLSGDALEFRGASIEVQTGTVGAAAAMGVVVAELVSSTSSPNATMLLAATSFLDQQHAALLTAGDQLQPLQALLESALDQLTSTPPSTLESLSAVSWLILWTRLVDGPPLDQSRQLALLKAIMDHVGGDPLRTGYFDAFQALFLDLLVARSTTAVPADPETVFLSLFLDANLGTREQWRILLLAHALGDALQPTKTFESWAAVKAILTRGATPSTTTAATAERAFSFMSVFALVANYKWDPLAAARLLPEWRDLLVAPGSLPAGMSIAAVYPTLAKLQNQHQTERNSDSGALMALSTLEQMLWLLDHVPKSDISMLVLRLLPTRLSALSPALQRSLLAVALRSPSLHLRDLLAKLEPIPTTNFVTLVLADLVAALSQDAVRLSQALEYAFSLLERGIELDSTLQFMILSTIVLPTSRNQAALLEPLVLSRPRLFASWLSPASAPPPMVALALELLFRLLLRHVSLDPPPASRNIWDQSSIDRSSSSSGGGGTSQDEFSMDDDLFFAAVEVETGFMHKLADDMGPLLDIVESLVMEHPTTVKPTDLQVVSHEWLPLVPLSKSFGAHLFRNAIAISAMAIKLFSDAKHDRFDLALSRTGHFRWPSPSVSLPIRAARAMTLAIQLLHVGCHLSDKKIMELFALCAFCEGPDALALNLIRRILLVSEGNTLLSPCLDHLHAISFRSRASAVEDIFGLVVRSIKADRDQLRARVFRLLPSLQIMHNVVEQVTSIKGASVQPLHELIMAISFEATIGSIALPPEFTVFATQYQHARSPVDSLSGLLRSVRAHSTNIPVYTRDGAAFPELAHLSLELRFVVDKFDEHFDQASAGLSAMLARLWAQMARDSNGSHQSYANERSVHGECMAGRQTCARHERLRAFLVWRHVDRRVRYAHDPTALAKALAVIVTVYGSLQAAWCPRELAPLWPHIGRILHIVQANTPGARLVAGELAAIAAASTHMQQISYLSEIDRLPDPYARIVWSVPRVCFAALLPAIARITAFVFPTTCGLQAMAEALLMVPGSKTHGSLSTVTAVTDGPATGGMMLDHDSTARFFTQAMRLWAAGAFTDPVVREYLQVTGPAFERHIEAQRPVLVPIFQHAYLVPSGMGCIPLATDMQLLLL